VLEFRNGPWQRGAHALVTTAAKHDYRVAREQPEPEVGVTSARRKLERQQRKKQGAAGSRGQPSKVTEIELRELQAILARAKAGPLGDAEVDKLKAAMDTLAFLTRELEAKGASIQRLRRMLFGPSTEKTSQVVGSKQGDATPSTATADTSPSAQSDVAQDEDASDLAPAADEASQDATPTPDADAPAPSSSATEPKRKGHGRNPAAAYTGANRVPCRTNPCTTRRRARSAGVARSIFFRRPHSSCACAEWPHCSLPSTSSSACVATPAVKCSPPRLPTASAPRSTTRPRRA
jgi:hypothetical protein